MSTKVNGTRYAGPAEFDTALAALYKQHDDITSRIAAAEQEAHRAAGDKRTYAGRTPVWGMTHADALAKAPAASARRDALFTELAGVQAGLNAMNKAYTGWSRFFPTDTKSGGHIHSSRACHTLYSTTVITWTPALSGRTVEEAVATLGPVLCQVCYPEAKAEWKRPPAEVARERNAGARAEAQAEKAARDAAKKLTGDEQFRTSGWSAERVTTVAKCKELIREAVQAGHEVTWSQGARVAANWGDNTGGLANYRANIAEKAELARRDAEQAERVLTSREARHEGYGMTVEAIADMKGRVGKKAAKDWAG